MDSPKKILRFGKSCGANMSAPSGGIEKVRVHVVACWRLVEALARFALVLWPWRNSSSHIGFAQFYLEVKQARRASAEKGGHGFVP